MVYFFMLQTKLIQGTDLPDLFGNLNLFLSQVQSDEKPTIHYQLNDLIIIVEYETNAAYKNAICCECQLWDDSGSSQSLIGFCQLCGQRKRFNCKACSSYKDVRA